MSVTYRRTFNLTYGIGESFTDGAKARFYNYLKDSGIFTTCNDLGQEIEYGTKIKQDEKTEYQIWLNSTTMQGTPVEYRMQAEAIVETFYDLYPEIRYEERTTIGDVEEIFLPTDRNLRFSNVLADALANTKQNEYRIVFSYYDDEGNIVDGEEIEMTASVWFHSYNQNMDLDFTITYTTDAVIRNTDIEQVLTEIPHFAMGYIQARFEEAIDATFNVSPSTTNIDCNFECVNLSRNKCDIDVVTKTRDARKEFWSEEE